MEWRGVTLYSPMKYFSGEWRRRNQSASKTWRIYFWLVNRKWHKNILPIRQRRNKKRKQSCNTEKRFSSVKFRYPWLGNGETLTVFHWDNLAVRNVSIANGPAKQRNKRWEWHLDISINSRQLPGESLRANVRCHLCVKKPCHNIGIGHQIEWKQKRRHALTNRRRFKRTAIGFFEIVQSNSFS